MLDQVSSGNNRLGKGKKRISSSRSIINTKFDESYSVINMSISSCDYLSVVEEGSVTRLPLLQRLLITRNPGLVYLHPRAVQQVIGLINSDTCSNGHLSCIFRNISM